MKITDTIKTLGKVVLKSRPAGRSTGNGKGKSLIVMGNGPSLRETISKFPDILTGHDTMAVNFAANTPEFSRLRPGHYILADPHFVDKEDPNVRKLWENLAGADRPMTLHLPVGMQAPELPANIRVSRYNMTPAEGYDGVCHALYAKGLAVPRPRNVLIPALMEGIREGYDEIWIVGADHTWPHTLYVDDRNRVVTVQPHFYEENPKELDRIAEAYAGVHIHDVLGSMSVAFRSYHAIRRYADKVGVKIWNATPGSLIDAFERKKLEEIRQKWGRTDTP